MPAHKADFYFYIVIASFAAVAAIVVDQGVFRLLSVAILMTCAFQAGRSAKYFNE